MEADLHIHTTASDGVFMPSEVVRLAALNKVKVISVTDHDTVDGIDEAVAAAKEYGIEIVPGIEISSTYREREVHILGYFLDYKQEWFVEFLNTLKNARYERAKRIVEKLKNLGVKIDFNEIQCLDNEMSLGRPHIARILVSKGYASDIPDAFSKYLVKGAPGFVEREKVSPHEAVQKIVRANGIPVLAHPGLISDFDLGAFIEELKGHGLKGIEVYHPSHDINMTKKIYKLAVKYRLALTGGSDYHGDLDGRNERKSGKARADVGSVGVTVETVEALKKLKQQIENEQTAFYA